MSITRLQQARQMYAMGKRVGRAFGGVMNSDGRRQYGGGSDAGKDGGYGYQGGGTNTSGVAGKGPASSGYSGGNTPSNDGPDNSPNIHTGPTYSPPTINPVDEVALTGFGTVPGVNYNYVGPDSKYQKNITLQNEFLNTPYQPVNIPPFIPGSTLINTAGNFLANLGYKKNTKFFADNVAGKYGYGYGLDDYKQYMQDRMSGKVGAYGNEEQGQNALSGQGGGGGIMDIYNLVNATDIDTDTDTEKFVSRFLQNRTPEEREAIEEQYQNYYTV